MSYYRSNRAPVGSYSEYQGSGFAASSVTQYSINRTYAGGGHHVGTYEGGAVGPASSFGLGGILDPASRQDVNRKDDIVDKPDSLSHLQAWAAIWREYEELEAAMSGLKRRFKYWRTWNLDPQKSRALVDAVLVKLNAMREAPGSRLLKIFRNGEMKTWQEELGIMSESLMLPLRSAEDKEDEGTTMEQAMTLSRHVIAVERLTAVRDARLRTRTYLRMTWMINKRTGRLSRWVISVEPNLTSPEKNLTKKWVMLDLSMYLYFRRTGARSEGGRGAMNLTEICCRSGKLRYGGKIVQYFRTEEFVRLLRA